MIRDSTYESHQPKYQSVVLNDGARIRIVNCSNDNSKPSSTRSSHSNSNKRSSNQSIDENGSTKMTRLHARKISSSNSKTAEITDISTSLYPTHALGLTNSEIARQWSTHCVFYRCHACSHEEFFVVFSRECMRLHVSSQHGNMEENFKQRLSNFLNNQGRALKIFQHYLKWQQPWSEKEIDQLFQLSNVPSTRTNGLFVYVRLHHNFRPVFFSSSFQALFRMGSNTFFKSVRRFLFCAMMRVYYLAIDFLIQCLSSLFSQNKTKENNSFQISIHKRVIPSNKFQFRRLSLFVFDRNFE